MFISCASKRLCETLHPSKMGVRVYKRELRHYLNSFLRWIAEKGVFLQHWGKTLIETYWCELRNDGKYSQIEDGWAKFDKKEQAHQ